MIVIAYIMAVQSKSYEAGLEFVKQRRKMAQPNRGFAMQLRKWYGSDAFKELEKQLSP